MKIVIHGEKTVTVTADSPAALDALLRQNGISLSMPCGGRHTCGKCRVRVAGSVSPKTEQEAELLGDADENVRLACFTQLTGDCEIFLNSEKTEIISDGFISDFPFSPVGDRYGFAVDIGTTTAAVYLYELKTGARLSQTAFKNPQSVFGADIISRIEAAMNGNAEKLQGLIGNEIAKAFAALCGGCGIAAGEIDTAVITGNTAMLYLLLAADVKCLAAAPFNITDYLGRWVTAAECGINGFSSMRVYLPRAMSAFVGSDITCSVLASSDLLVSPGASVLIDIGTNGEMAIYREKRLLCCSTAAGPAFEGAGITMGSVAAPGAVNKAWIYNDEIWYTTVGGKKASGICGSGLISAAAVFVGSGLIDETGCINSSSGDFERYLCEYNGQSALMIGDSGVVLTQKDIRAVQLAKSAIRAGLETLLDSCGITAEETDRLLLAGGFGSSISAASAGAIGLIPRQLAAKATAVGNAAGMGAVAILLSEAALEKSVQLAEGSQTLELSTSPFFMNSYIENMMF